MRIRVRLDIRLSLKQKKKLLLANGKHHYVHFEYENLTLFYFLCRILGASSQRATPPTSIWLREEVPIGVPNLENSFGKIKGIRDNSLNSYPQNMANTNLDDKETGYLQGKLTS
ncbi:hypothetical protein Goari_026999 [Gossypium aridum]|uniref:Uncharacterized protein n=1 Tax=Gossypium aridum TaxID=34290 RepID=A0A7J8YNE9_GOSAI|nr:hypothetical protein [Gossypium aridum]